MEIITIFVPFIALILIASTFRNMDIHVSEQGHADKCTCRNRVFCCWWSIAKKTDISLFDAKFLADIPLTYHTIVKWRMSTNILYTFTVEKQNTHNWINDTSRNRVHNSSSHIHHSSVPPQWTYIKAIFKCNQKIEVLPLKYWIERRIGGSRWWKVDIKGHKNCWKHKFEAK